MRKSMLIMSAMMLMSTAVFADWTAPTITGQAAVQDGETEQYLFNTGAKAFFLGANDWSTRASVSETKGYKVKFKPVEGTDFIEILDYCETKSKWMNVAAWSATDIYVDRATQDGWQDFKLVTTTGNQFNIWQESNAGNWAVGSESYPENTRIYYDTDTTNVKGTPLNEWISVSEEEYTTYAAKMAAYVAAKELKAAIDAAKAKYPSLDLAAEEAVYNNEESTAEELKAAIASVAEKVKAADIAAAEQNASPENPFNLTSSIENPGFDGNANGWTGGPALNNGVAEFYNKTYTLAQSLENMPNGVYALSVQGYYRAGWSDVSWRNYHNADANRNAMLYAINSNDTVTSPLVNIWSGIEANVKVDENGNYSTVTEGDYSYYCPNNMATGAAHFNAGQYKDNVVLFGINEGKMTIGLTKSVTLDGDWTLFDNFALNYYGNSENSYKYWIQQLVANTPADAYDDENLLVTAVYVEAFKEALANANDANNYESVMANIAAINAAKAAIVENMAAWQALLAEKAEAMETANNKDIECDEKDDLGDYIEEEVNGALANLELTTEEIREMIATLKQMVADAINAGLKKGSEIPLKNYDFSDTTGAGWTFEPKVTGINAHCAESWNQGSFDYYQVVEGAPAGVYTITMQGFYRAGNNDVAWPAYYDAETGEMKDNVAEVNAFVYLNDSKTRIANLYSERIPNGEVYSTKADYEAANGAGSFVGPEPYVDPLGEYWYPNGMTTAGEAFDEGYYQVSASGLVGKNVPMRIGVKGSTANAAWAIFTRFHLIYMGFDETIIKPMLEEELGKLTAGLVGAELAEQIASVKANAEAALASTAEDAGKQMYNALLDIYAIEEKIEASAKVFEELTAKNGTLADAMASSTASTATKNEAIALWSEVDDALTNATYTTDEAKAKIQAINDMIGKLRIPADVDSASDENPVDLTAVIQTPSFDNEGINSIEGWTVNGGYNFGNNDTQKAALCLEFYQQDFNIYQDLNYLPAGTYGVEANAFFRPGEGSTCVPVLYGIAENDSIVAYVVIRDSEYSAEMLGYDGETELKNEGEETAYGYVPNDMVSAGGYFDMGYYKNGLNIKVGESGKLRIGMSAANHANYDWVIMDNFTLTYYGANSQKPVGPTGIEEVATTKVQKIEIFNLNGQKVNVAENGIFVVRMTLENGEVITKKLVK